MSNSNVMEFIKDQTFTIAKDIYVILKTTKTISDALAVLQIDEEITVIMDQYKATHAFFTKEILMMDRDWKRITFNLELPFDLIGFLSTISQALANDNIPIFALSGFSTDHILIKHEHIDKAIQVLENLGFRKE